MGIRITSDQVSISVVSHAQIALVMQCLADLQRCCEAHVAEVLLTVNIPEELPATLHQFTFPVRVIRNPKPQGFGANHNQAATLAKSTFFCVLNPDARLQEDVFSALLGALAQDLQLGVVAPRIVNAQNRPEDSARYFPTPWELLGKLLLHRASRIYPVGEQAIAYPDWVAGMFMLFHLATFREMGGFNQRYFLYYEDVDLCARLWLARHRVGYLSTVRVVHDAQRTSHRQLKYTRWHVTSILRFFASPVFWALLIRRWR